MTYMIYGNPSYLVVQSIKNSILLREWLTQGVLQPVINLPYPNERATKRELWMLVAMGSVVDSKRLEYCLRLDEDLHQVMSEYLASYGVTASREELKGLLDPYHPIIEYLKVVHNRPRPFQTAGVYDIPLYPRVIRPFPEASYPSGHTLLALFFYHIYGARHPHLKKELMQFVMDVKLSREQVGVHYPSDNLYSFQIYRHLQPFMPVYNTSTHLN